jgi:hypothetical protein
MIPQEKAKQLWQRFWYEFPAQTMIDINGKNCAIACVDEICAALPTYPQDGSYVENSQDAVDASLSYWQDVKAELEKL